MPNSQEILSGLHLIANQYYITAIVWHIVLYLVLILLLFNWRPGNKMFVMAMSLPLISVSMFAWISGNPFNGSLFGAFALAALFFGMKADMIPVRFSGTPYRIAGLLLIAFGLAYPHFIEADSILTYLFASPAGLIPCPTLSVLIGFLLLLNLSYSRGLTLTLLMAGLFYGLFGVFRLGVYLDSFLLSGSLVLLGRYVQFSRKSSQ